jgi:uncharacterized 2Fe-2S/4Fe-4S cluster protein (DUF4445 family)
MADLVTLKLLPADFTCQVPRGTPLHDILYKYGIEFPCGGRGRCGGCRVKLLHGALPAAPGKDYRLAQADIDAGWRLCCKHSADSDLVLEVKQWESVVLVDNTPFAFTPSHGRGVAIDIGTTTLAAQLLDLETGHVLAVRTAKNPQGKYGADIMSRISYAVQDKGQLHLEQLIRQQLLAMIEQLLHDATASDEPLTRIALVGNTPMQHLFCGIDVSPLAHYPFEPRETGLRRFAPSQLGWHLPESATVVFLPNLGSFVGSDILAGVLATRLYESEQLTVFVDLGTNGEMVVGTRERLLCASTAAGPAFEAARISMGMQATTGAISEVSVHDRQVHCRVLGGGEARGICGSGLVDAAAAALELGFIDSSGRFVDGVAEFDLQPPVKLVQADLRELQLAKGAVAAGIRILLKQLGYRKEDVAQVYVAGAFGNYVRLSSARRIGLLDFPLERIKAVDNTALLGAKLALFMSDAELDALNAFSQRIGHVALHADPEFQDIYVDELFYP